MDITPEEIRITVERPDKVMNCDSCKRCFYIKKFEDKGELLVFTEKIKDNINDIKCFGWLQSILYPS